MKCSLVAQPALRGMVLAAIATVAIATTSSQVQATTNDAGLDSLRAAIDSLRTSELEVDAELNRIRTLAAKYEAELAAALLEQSLVYQVSSSIKQGGLLRSRPDRGADVLGVSSRGDIAIVRDQQDGFFYVETGGLKGWVGTETIVMTAELESAVRDRRLQHDARMRQDSLERETIRREEAEEAELKQEERAAEARERREAARVAEAERSRVEAVAASRREAERRVRLTKEYGQADGSSIADHKVWIGMTSAMARESWGEPARINRTVSKYGVSEQWVYGIGQYLSMDDGVLQTISQTQ